MVSNNSKDSSKSRLEFSTIPQVQSPAEQSARGEQEEQSHLHMLCTAPDNSAHVAIHFKGISISYQELHSQSNQLASYFSHTLNIGPEDVVAVSLNRSPELIIAFLAILKTGAIYFPIDPAYPEARILQVLGETRPAAILTSNQRIAGPEFPSRNILSPQDLNSLALPQGADTFKARPALPGNAAYLIYTSGSTGRPKGALITRRGLSNLIEAQKNTFGIQPKDRVLQFASIAFDASIWEIVMALSAGATLVMAPESELLPGMPLARLLQHENITTLTLTPTVLGTLPIGMESALDRLETLVVAGEACPLPLARRWSARRRMFNAYGPTETTVCATIQKLDARPLNHISIGTPLSKVICHVLDSQGREVKAGETGELFVGGPGVARAYFNQPALSAERFLPDPFSSAAGARMYRTGDLVVKREDGAFDFIGRADEQIKLHGIRIELGEIEALLREHPDIQDAVVALKTNESGQPVLAAYYIARASCTISDTQVLRAHLRLHLPPSMIPAVYIPIAHMPTSPTGKLDRNALPKPDAALSARGAAAPANELENLVSSLWSAALHKDNVQPSDNFFNMGGNSIIAAQIVGHLEQNLKVSLPLSALFESPTVSSLAATLAQKSSKVEKEKPFPALKRREGGNQVPLSSIQRQIWFLSKTDPASPVYNETLVFEIHRALDIQLFERVLHQIAQRHEALRTTFAMHERDVLATIQRAMPLPFSYADLRSVPAAQKKNEALQRMQQMAKIPFDLASGPLARSLLLQIDTNVFQFCLIVHHIISDRISIYYIFIPELIEAYSSAAAGKPASLGEAGLQYSDFAVWQYNLIQSGALNNELAFWKEVLGKEIVPLRLPTLDQQQATRIPFAGRRVQFALPQQSVHALKAFGQKEHLTPFMIFLTAYLALLQRYADQSDIIIGTIDASRKEAGLNSVVGNFLQTIVLRTNINAECSFGALLHQVRTAWLSALSNSNIPFELLVQELHPARQVGQNPLFQVAFAFHPPIPQYPDQWALSLEELDTETSKFDLTLFARETPAGVLCALEYNTNIFHRDTIERMAGHYSRLIEQVALNPGVSLARIDFLGDEEKQSLRAWSHLDAPPSPYMCISDFLGRRAAEHPAAPAILYEDQVLSYQDLNERANQLAHYLQSRGVRTETMVAVVLEHCPDLLISLFAILKAGGTYIPIEPSYPPARIALMLEDARARVLITHRKHLSLLSPDSEITVCLDDIGDIIAAQPLTPPVHRAGPENTAYVIYTSGSTGTPKGAQITRRGVWELLEGLQAVFHLAHADRILQFGSISFDISIGEFVMALAPGASLVIAPESLRLPGMGLVQYMLDMKVTAFSLTPTVLNDFPADSETALQLVRTLVVAGEACPLSLIQRWAPGRRMFNMYGPTETTVCTTLGDLSVPNLQKVPIGKPIARLTCHVLDSHGQPLPQGLAGELFIGGSGVGRGYLNRPQLSAERFVPDPFSSVPGARMYKTGDLVRWQNDGNLEFIGRIDNQIKIRGARIELGELEALLQGHPEVKDAIAAVKSNPNNDQHLIAYVIPKPGASASLDSVLREYIRVRVPAFLMPAFILILERFPLLSSGKTDRKRLPDPPHWYAEPNSRRMRPTNETERMVANIWQQILGQANIGLDDNFFDIGGNSLLIARVQNALQKSMNKSIAIVELFRHPTIRSLAQHLTEDTAPSPPSGLIHQGQERAARQKQALERQKQLAALKRKGS